MNKPRFPLSVTHNFVYRARIECTGEILETESFKDLYKFVRKHLRYEVFRENSDIRYADAVLEYGDSTDYEARPGYFYTEWHPISNIGRMEVCFSYEIFHRTSDDADHIINEFCYRTKI